MKFVDPRYIPTVPDGYVWVENIILETVDVDTRLDTLNEMGIPTDALMMVSFTPESNAKPIRAILAKDTYAPIITEYHNSIGRLFKKLERLFRDAESEDSN